LIIEGRQLETFSVETRPDRGRVFVVPCGELDLSTVGAVSACVDELVDAGWERIVLDLRSVSFMDSTGLRMVLRETARDEAHVTLVDGAPPVSRIFDLTGMRSRLPFEAAP
jgi:anti-sigma B factor antagonist